MIAFGGSIVYKYWKRQNPKTTRKMSKTLIHANHEIRWQNTYFYPKKGGQNWVKCKIINYGS